MEYDIVVIGSGPGGYVAAIRAAQLGMRVAVVERAELGGVCLNWGCIPTKALLKSAQVYSYAMHAEAYGVAIGGEIKPDLARMVERSRAIAGMMSKGVQFLLAKNKVTLIAGEGSVASAGSARSATVTGSVDSAGSSAVAGNASDAGSSTSFGNTTAGIVTVTGREGEKTELKARHIILATGARPRELPFLTADGERIITSRQALTLTQLPESMIVIGSGAIGCELAGFYASLGTKVTIVEYLPNLMPLEDEDVSRLMERSFRKARINVMTAAEVKAVERAGEKCRVGVTSKKGEEVLEADVVLSAVGIKSNIENLGLESLGVTVERDKIVVDEWYRSNVPGIYAIGDIVHGPSLAHLASAEAICCVEKIAGLDTSAVDYANIPSCIYTTPEVASVGMTEKEAVEAGFEVKTGKFPYTASGKATAAGDRDGFVKLVSDARTDTLLGAHLVGSNVTEMIAEPTLARALGGKVMDMVKTIHPHPTMSEAIMEAAAAVHGEAIHI